MRERQAAGRLSDGIDRILDGHRYQGTGAVSSAVADELETARRLSQISARLPPVPPDLERRVRAIVESPPPYRITGGYRPAASRYVRGAFPVAWGALAATVVFLAIWLSVPGGQEAWAQVLRALRLGQARVELTPTIESQEPVVRESLRDLLAAELLMGRAPSLPKALPEGYLLQEIAAVTYPDLPAWISQPLFIELSYGLEGESPGLRLRQYRLLFRQYGGITGIEVASDKIASLEQVEVAGVPGSLLTDAGEGATYTLIWERDGLLLELESGQLTKDELLRLARLIR